MASPRELRSSSHFGRDGRDGSTSIHLGHPVCLPMASAEGWGSEQAVWAQSPRLVQQCSRVTVLGGRALNEGRRQDRGGGTTGSAGSEPGCTGSSGNWLGSDGGRDGGVRSFILKAVACRG